MEFVTVKHENSIAAGKLINGGEDVVVVVKDGINHTIKIIRVINENLGDFLDEANELYKIIANFFDNNFKRLPIVIEYEDVKYRLTIIPGRNKVDTKVQYQTEAGEHKVLLTSTGKNGMIARENMRKVLKEKGWF